MRISRRLTQQYGSYGDDCVAFNASYFALRHALGVGMMFVVRFEHLDRATEDFKLRWAVDIVTLTYCCRR